MGFTLKPLRLITFILLGKLLRRDCKRAYSEATSKIRLPLQPATAHVLRDGEFVDIPTSKVVAGDILQVRGEAKKIPVDGTITDAILQ